VACKSLTNRSASLELPVGYQRIRLALRAPLPPTSLRIPPCRLLPACQRRKVDGRFELNVGECSLPKQPQIAKKWESPQLLCSF
jgi:hypothetical protein